MDASVSIQRPRPQNLLLGFGGSLPDFKSFTASLKAPMSDFITNYRSITSATLKTESLIENGPKESQDKANLELGFKEQIVLIKKKREEELEKAKSKKIEKVLEVGSDKENNSSEGLNKVSSPRNSNSETQNSGNFSRRELELILENKSSYRRAQSAKTASLNASPSISQGKLCDQGTGSTDRSFTRQLMNEKISAIEKEFEKERAVTQQMISEKTQEIERLQSHLQRLEQENASEVQEKEKLVEEKESLRALLEQKASEIESAIQEKEQAKVNMDNVAKELAERKTELESFRTKYEQLNQEVSAVKLILGDKDVRIHTLEAEVKSLIHEQEQSQRVFQQIHEAKVLINEFNEKMEISPQAEILPALQLLLEECKKSQMALKEETLRIKDLDEQVKQSKAEVEMNKAELSQTIQKLEAEKLGLIIKLEQNNELAVSLGKIKEENASLHTTIASLNEEKIKLNEKLNEYTEKLNSSLAEIQTFKESIESEEKLKTENEELQKRLEEVQVHSQQQIIDFQEKMIAKDHYIEVLISDVQQMKEFIVEHHGESVFERDDKEEKEVNQEEEEVVREECETRQENELSKETEEKREQIVEETHQHNEETTRNKVVVIVEKPYYRGSPHKGWHESNHHRDSYESNYYRDSYDRRRPYRRYWREEPKVVYEPKNSSQYNQEKESEYRYETRSTSRGTDYETVAEAVKDNKVDFSKDKKTREEDPVYKQLEKMIKELNEKLVSNEKKYKKMYEEKLVEASRLQQEKEQSLLVEIENLKDDRKNLLKKIDDIQWEKAYEFSERMKAEKEAEAKALEAANKQKQNNQAALDASKKKKKK